MKGHKCGFKEPQLFIIEVLAEDEEEGNALMDEEYNVQDSEEACILLQALTGEQTFHTMRIVGFIKQKPLHILIDSGSTHNFLDIEYAKTLGCEFEQIVPQTITMADGNKLACQYKSRNFTWRINGAIFITDVLLISIGSCDMVLGIQWLRILGDISWNFQDMTMQFRIKEQHFCLKGVADEKLQVVERALNHNLATQSIHLCLLQTLHPTDCTPSLLMSALSEPVLHIESGEIEKIKEVILDVFSELNELPPARGVFDHRIPMEEGVRPINIRPYRYPLKHRDIIEQLVQEMLDWGIIQHSDSPYASPVVLVSKKDGSWRLCVDYRQLNQHTVRNKFPIPVLEELIDELGGSKIFSKIDLRAGYYQLRMHASDVFKTAFKTHIGHYEFLVMPFGLTNAPASFQNWMNQVFKLLLRKCVIIFFDSILVYSKSLAEHYEHLHSVFSIMRQNHMYAKSSNCIFAIDKIEYLGHFISSKGVETDPRKVEAVQNWPTPTTVKELKSFLGLAGYYRRFIRSHATKSRALTDLLKKGNFTWNDKSTRGFLETETGPH